MELTVGRRREEGTSSTTQISLALQLKLEREVSRLRECLKRQLQRDMKKLFDEKSFANVNFVIENGEEISSHSAILKTRVPRFYRFCVERNQLFNQASVSAAAAPALVVFYLRGVNESELQTFLREVYYRENMEEAENQMLEQLRAGDEASLSPLHIPDREFRLEQSLKTDEEECYAEGESENPSAYFSHLPVEVDQAMEKTEFERDNIFDITLGEKAMFDLNPQKNETFDLNLEKVETFDLNIQKDETFDLNMEKDKTFDLNMEKDKIEVPIYLGAIGGVSNVNSPNDFENGVVYDLINFDEVKSDNTPAMANATDSTTSIGILDFDVNSMFSSAETDSRLEVDKVAGFSRDNSELTKSKTDDGFISILKSSAGQEALELKLGSKDGQAMIRSHDSGMCSMSRKLSTSSLGPPSFSPCSEPAGNSSNESLPKDDSLECCLDSLANDDTNESSVFGGLDSTCSSKNLNTFSNAIATDVGANQLSASFPSTCATQLSSWKTVFSSKKRSLLDVNNGVIVNSGSSISEPARRWSVSSSDFPNNNNGSKPAAIVLPYNANADLQLVSKNEDSNGSSENEPAQADNNNSESENRGRGSSPPVNVFSIVPFLREEHRVQSRHSEESSPSSSNLTESNFTVENSAQPLIVHVEETRTNTFELDTAAAPAPDVVSSYPTAESDGSTGLTSNNNNSRLAPSHANHVVDIAVSPAAIDRSSSTSSGGQPPPPPPVYMYIEAECHSPAPLRPRPAATSTSTTSTTTVGKGQIKTGELGSRTNVPLRRKILGGGASLLRRPKSETAASLFPLAEDSLVLRNKRVSLILDDDDAKSTHSLEGMTTQTLNRRSEGPCSKLGDDLLKMFLNEIDTDVTVVVNGKEIKAHKSVLSSRCVYFAAAMSGNWIESSGNVINMSGFSYDAVHFAICHIYSGASVIPESIDISELASLADMLGFEGLKDVVALAMKMKYCHFFHKPCVGCSTTVSESFLIAASFGLDDLQEKCLKWINKHMLKTWPTKSFAALPEELLQKCLTASKLDINEETVLELTVRCEKLTSTLPRVKWVEPVAALARQLSGACTVFLADNLADVVGSQAFRALQTGHTWTIHVLEASLIVAAENTSLIGACRSYVRIHALKSACEAGNVSKHAPSPEINENFDVLLNKIHRQVEHFLIHNANRVVRCAGWSLLSPELQQRIKDAAVIVFEFGKPTAAPPKLSSQNKKFTSVRSSASNSSSSPVVLRNRVGVNSKALSKSLHMTLEDKSGRNSRSFDKAATLPRTFSTNKSTTFRKEENTDHISKLKSAATNNSRPLLNGKQQPQTSHNGVAQRPKSLNLKERSSSATTTKPVTKELTNSSKSLIPVSSVSLRSATGTSSKYSSGYRSKSVVYNGSSRVTKSATNSCSNGNDLYGKENKDETKSLAASKAKSEETSRPGLRKIGQRASITRTSCSSAVKV